MTLLRTSVSALLIVLLWPLAAAQATDYFGRPDSPPAASSRSAQSAPLESRIRLPEPFRSLLSKAVFLQSELNACLRSELKSAQYGNSWHPALIIVLASFLYGVLHAIGPGHGKVVVASYLLTRRSRFVHALGMSCTVAATQAVTAVVLAAVLAAVFNATGKTILDRAATIEMASYAAICLLGLWMAWTAVKPGPRRACSCGLHHHENDHEHHHAAQDCKPLIEVLTTGVIAGLRPCSGAILVLLFTLANGIFPIGIVAACAMGVGVAITVTVVSVGAFGVNRAISTAGASRPTSQWLGRGVALAGALVITAFGATALFAIATGVTAPMIG